MVAQRGEQRLDGVQHDALGADRVDGRVQADEQAVQIVFAGLHDLVAVDCHRIDHQLLAGDQVGQIEAERADIRRQVVGALLEAHEDAGLVVVLDATDQEFHAHQRLAAAGAAADQRRPAAREAAAGDGIEAVDAGGAFRQLWQRWCRDGFLGATHGRCLSLWAEAATRAGGDLVRSRRKRPTHRRASWRVVRRLR